MKTLLSSVAHPWQCDVLGHLTTRFYVAMFDDASYHLIYRLFGWNGNRDESGKLAWTDVRHTINYKAEVAAGDLLEVQGGLLKIGGKSITVSFEMKKTASGELAATLESVMVLFDLESRSAVAIGDDMRAKASTFLPL